MPIVPEGHALLSPSSAHRWLVCPGSVALESAIPNRSSTFADEGTKAHELAANALLNNGLMPACDDREMGRYVKQYVDAVTAACIAIKGNLFVEQKLSLTSITGEEDAFGTADGVIISGDGKELRIDDLKYGLGVEVYAENNEQLMIYALAALKEFEMMGNFKWVTLCIHQVRLKASEGWTISVEELKEFGERVSLQAFKIFDNRTYLHPTEKACRFCRAKSTCPALTQKVHDTIDFASVETSGEPTASQVITTQARLIDVADAEKLGRLLPLVPLIEGWCKAVTQRAESVMHQGGHIPGYKLVEGKRGNRKWTNEGAVEEALKSMRLTKDEMYNLKLISPTDAENVLADNPRKWNKIQKFIARADGKPTVVPEHDKRPAIVINDENMFNQIGEE